MNVNERMSVSSDISQNQFFYFYYIIFSEVRLSPLGTAATTGIVYEP
jgi:hypothetical protein